MSTTLCYMCLLALHPHSLTHVWQPVCTAVWVFELWLLFHSRNFPWYFYASQHVSASASSMTRPSPTESQSQSAACLISSVFYLHSPVCLSAGSRLPSPSAIATTGETHSTPSTPSGNEINNFSLPPSLSLYLPALSCVFVCVLVLHFSLLLSVVLLSFIAAII